MPVGIRVTHRSFGKDWRHPSPAGFAPEFLRRNGATFGHQDQIYQAEITGDSQVKQITAILKPFKLEEVCEALAECGVTGLTVTEVEAASGCQKGHTGFIAAEYVVDFLPR